MDIVRSQSLQKGETLIDYAFSSCGDKLNLSVPDYVGIIAAYLAKGKLSNDLEADLASTLGPAVGRGAKQVFAIFDDPFGGGLWSQGPALEDIRFTSRKLASRFPSVNAANDRLMTR